MNQASRYRIFAIGLVTGAVVVGMFFTTVVLHPQSCEPVVDVEYKREGKDWVPQTVVRKPVRDGSRCLLAEAGS